MISVDILWHMISHFKSIIVSVTGVNALPPDVKSVRSFKFRLSKLVSTKTKEFPPNQ